jgi:hypothetical protein
MTPEGEHRDVVQNYMAVDMDCDRKKVKFVHEDYDTICWNCRAADLRKQEREQDYHDKPYTLGPDNKLYKWDRLPVSTAEQVAAGFI